MELLAEITEKSLGMKSADEILEHTFLFRKSARAILLNEKDEVSLQLVGKFGYHKLPGGGVDRGETEEEALRREVREEVGCDLTIIAPLGITIEYRTKHNLLHISYGYLCRVDGAVTGPSYEQGEIDDQYESVWMPVEKAKQLLEQNAPTPPDHYEARFIIERERVFFNRARNLIKEKTKRI